MRAIDLIIKKRSGGILSYDELAFLINGYVSNQIPDYQISSLLMSIFFNGLNFNETADLTKIMIKSGKRLDFSSFDGIKTDKHSTGGVGDKLSLIIAPIAASCGCIIPMMSGRGLGHTGGTLDKFESIPGYNVFPSEESIMKIMKECSFVMMGQTDDVVPADKKLYALRDVTGTVESIPLITSSIMSKKIAEGSNALVIDLKCGNGAFMKDMKSALKLSNFMMGVAEASDVKMKVVISDMNVPIGKEVGNYNEVLESYDALCGNGDGRMMELVYRLAGWMVYLSGKSSSIEDAVGACRQSVADGKAVELFLKNIELQGGDADYILNPRVRYAKTAEVKAVRDGFIESINAYDTGIASMYIGCGRRTKESPIDHYAGITVEKKIGEYVKEGDVIFTIRYNDGEIEEALSCCRESVKITDSGCEIKSLILEELG